MTGKAGCQAVRQSYNIRPSLDLPGRDSLTFARIIAGLLALALTACTGPDKKAPMQPLPQRIQLHYDYSGDWIATAGDQCAERLNLSEAVFLSIGASPQKAPGRYHIADFFLLEPGEPAQAVVGTVDGDGKSVV